MATLQSGVGAEQFSTYATAPWLSILYGWRQNLHVGPQ